MPNSKHSHQGILIDFYAESKLVLVGSKCSKFASQYFFGRFDVRVWRSNSGFGKFEVRFWKAKFTKKDAMLLVYVARFGVRVLKGSMFGLGRRTQGSEFSDSTQH